MVDNIKIQYYSTIGNVRDQNEDALIIKNNIKGEDKTMSNILLSGLFDGHGGGGVSKTLIDEGKINICKYFTNPNSIICSKLSPSHSYNNKCIIPLFNRIQEKLKNYYISSNIMGSTSLISLFYPYKTNKLNLKVINLGDSRAVICSEYNIGNALTLDHKPALYCENDRIKALGGKLEYIKGDDPRIGGMSVSRAFGDLDNKYISQKPDIFDYVISNQKFIIMGCDGVWDVLGNQEAVDFVLSKCDELNKTKLEDMKGKSEKNIACKLADYAIAKGSTDNISVIIIFFMNNLN